MSEDVFDPEKAVPFDEYYAWLKEFVESLEARKQVARYDAAVERFAKETGESPNNAWDEDDEAYNALFDYRMVGSRILERHGWPNYAELVKWQPERRKDYINIIDQIYAFSDTGAVIIRGVRNNKHWIEGLRNLKPNINEKISIYNYLKVLSENPSYRLNVDMGVGHE